MQKFSLWCRSRSTVHSSSLLFVAALLAPLLPLLPLLPPTAIRHFAHRPPPYQRCRRLRQ